jgi:SAM-dependent methyltransferase
VRATPSPNIWSRPDLYERLNEAADPDGLVPATLDELLGAGAAPAGVVDVGCGTGFQLPLLAQRAGRVDGVEPHPALAERARARVRRARLDQRVQVHTAVAQHLPLPDRSVDLVFSHWAYFFGPGCEPGLDEADRVLRPGGLQVVVDVDLQAGDGYSRWLAAAGTAVRSDRSEAFFAARGFTSRRVPVVWRCRSRDDLAAVLGIEFPPRVAAQALAATPGTTLSVPTVLRWRRAPSLSDPPPTVPSWRDRRPRSGAPTAGG